MLIFCPQCGTRHSLEPVRSNLVIAYNITFACCPVVYCLTFYPNPRSWDPCWDLHALSSPSQNAGVSTIPFRSVATLLSISAPFQSSRIPPDDPRWSQNIGCCFCSDRFVTSDFARHLLEKHPILKTHVVACPYLGCDSLITANIPHQSTVVWLQRPARLLQLAPGSAAGEGAKYRSTCSNGHLIDLWVTESKQIGSAAVLPNTASASSQSSELNMPSRASSPTAAALPVTALTPRGKQAAKTLWALAHQDAQSPPARRGRSVCEKCGEIVHTLDLDWHKRHDCR